MVFLRGPAGFGCLAFLSKCFCWLGVATCNRNTPGLQSAHFPARIICNWACNHPRRPATIRFRPTLSATETRPQASTKPPFVGGLPGMPLCAARYGFAIPKNYSRKQVPDKLLLCDFLDDVEAMPC
jgi:hypothetical protein